MAISLKDVTIRSPELSGLQFTPPPAQCRIR